MKKMVLASLVGAMVVASQGCAWVMSTPSGLREMGRAANGLVVTGKARANEADEYHVTQRSTDPIRIRISGGEK